MPRRSAATTYLATAALLLLGTLLVQLAGAAQPDGCRVALVCGGHALLRIQLGLSVAAALPSGVLAWAIGRGRRRLAVGAAVVAGCVYAAWVVVWALAVQMLWG